MRSVLWKEIFSQTVVLCFGLYYDFKCQCCVAWHWFWLACGHIMAGYMVAPKTEVPDLAVFFFWIFMDSWPKLIGKEKMRLKTLVMAQINRISPLKNWVLETLFFDLWHWIVSCIDIHVIFFFFTFNLDWLARKEVILKSLIWFTLKIQRIV